MLPVTNVIIPGFRGNILQNAYEVIIEILWKFFVLYFLFFWSNQATMLHMPRQLSCRVMCKIVTWFDFFSSDIDTYIYKICIMMM